MEAKLTPADGWVYGWVEGWASGQSGVRGRSGLSDPAFHWPAIQARSADLLSSTRRVHADQRSAAYAASNHVTGPGQEGSVFTGWCTITNDVWFSQTSELRRGNGTRAGPQGSVLLISACAFVPRDEDACDVWKRSSDASVASVGSKAPQPQPRTPPRILVLDSQSAHSRTPH